MTSAAVPNPIAPPADSVMARPDFTWGVATASFQIEGSTQVDGRLPSIWDTFCATPGKVLGGDTGEPGCDHYRRADADVDLIADLGVDAYRLSIAWPRVMHIDGTPNERGIAFYERLLDRLAARGLKAMVTLYHWDLPQHLEDAGGWLNRETAYRFAEYADLMSRRLAGKVHAWATLNEPWCSAFLGYGNGHHAPGKSDPKLATQAMHHLLLGHGLALGRGAHEALAAVRQWTYVPAMRDGGIGLSPLLARWAAGRLEMATSLSRQAIIQDHLAAFLHMAVDYKKKKGGGAPYSMDANLLHISYEGGILEDPWFDPTTKANKAMFKLSVSPEDAPNKAEYVELEFERGDCVAVNGKKLSPAGVLRALNKLGGRHGIGRVDLLENRYVGMKSRGCYETPAGTVMPSSAAGEKFAASADSIASPQNCNARP